MYFAPAWAYPGGGFEGSIIGDFMVALQMNKDKVWSGSSNGAKFTDERIVKPTELKENGGNTLELTFEKPAGIEYQKGQTVILRLRAP